MRFAVVFKKLVNTEGLDDKIGLEKRYEDEVLAVYADEDVVYENGKLLLGYRTFGDGPIRSINEVERLVEYDDLFDGKYLQIDLDKCLLFSDPVGLQQVYVGDGVLASEKKLVKRVSGMSHIFPLSPGKLYGVNIQNDTFNLNYVRSISSLFRSSDNYFSSLDNFSKLYLSLVRRKIMAIKKYVNGDVKDVYISFSGGVDSSVVAKLSSDLIGNVNLVTVCAKDSFDEANSRRSAELLGLKTRHIIHYIDKETILGEIKDVIYVIEDWRLMQVSLALPLHILMKSYASDSVVLMGQGSDEMFGGYKKYLNLLSSQGAEAANREMLLDIYLSYRNNFSREQKLADFHKCRLYYPLITPASVILAGMAPLSFKIKDEHDEVRKWVIRRVAEYIGLPDDIALRHKKALQYSSKVQQLLLKTFGRKRRDALLKIYDEVMN